MSNIGIMDPAFFVPAKVLLQWLNDFFKVNYAKVEQCSTGAIHCQILDAIFPGKVPLSKVNFEAKHDYEYIANYKVLQSVFDKEHIEKHVDVPKLIKSKYQDNLEFLQWMKHFFDSKYVPQDGVEYDAVAKREKAVAAYKKNKGGAASKSTSSSSSSAATAKPAVKAPAMKAPAAAAAAPPAKPAAKAAPLAAAAAAATKKPAAAAPSSASKPTKAAVGAGHAHPAAHPAPAHAHAPAAAPAPVAAAAAADASAADSETVESLSSQLSGLRVTIEGLEKERNFYYGKLREIEILCQADNGQPVVEVGTVEEFKAKIFGILYQTDENADFQDPATATGAATTETPAEEAAAVENDVQDELQADPAAGAEAEPEEGLLDDGASF